MLAKGYVSIGNNRLPKPRFIPGSDSSATGILFLAGPTLGLAAVILQPEDSFFSNQHSSCQNPKSAQIVLVDPTPRIIEEHPSDNASTIPYSEHASLVSFALGLGKSDVARILGISRPTLYSWIKGESEPRASDHPDRLRKLGELTAEICKESKRPLYHRFVEEPLVNQYSSILTLLLADVWNETQLRPLLAEARRLTSERDQRLGHAIPINISKSKQEANLLDNSIALNLE